MRYGSVCSGIEAATVSWHPLGWKPAFFSDIEAFPRAVLANHYPDVPCHGDFTTIKGDEYGAIDLLCGGTPCQSFSVAGLRKGFDDDRGNLTLEFVRLVDRTKPRWVVWENVPGVLSIDGGRAFGSLLGGLGQCGYGVAYRVLDAQYFGVPQRRRRVFVVGYLGDWRPAAAVLFERESLRGDITPRREAREGIASYTKGCFGSYDEGVGTLRAHGGDIGGGSETLAVQTFDRQSSGEYGTAPVASTVSARDYKSPSDLISYGIPGNWIGRAPENGGNAVEPMHDVAPCLTKADRHGVAQPIGWSEELTASTDLAGTLQRGGNGGRHDGVMTTDMQVRRLTPRECERLQGFPDDYTLIPISKQKWADKNPAGVKYAADGSRYKAIGNSMAVPVMRWIGERIEMIDKIKGEIK